VARAELKQPFVAGERTLEQELDASAGWPARVQTRLDHTRVVEHHNIAVVYKARKIGERNVFARTPVDVQQPAVAAPYSGRLRDELGRKVVIEIGERESTHAEDRGSGETVRG